MAYLCFGYSILGMHSAGCSDRIFLELYRNSKSPQETNRSEFPNSPQLFSGQHEQMMQNMHEYLRRSHFIPTVSCCSYFKAKRVFFIGVENCCKKRLLHIFLYHVVISASFFIKKIHQELY